MQFCRGPRSHRLHHTPHQHTNTQHNNKTPVQQTFLITRPHCLFSGVAAFHLRCIDRWNSHDAFSVQVWRCLFMSGSLPSLFFSPPLFSPLIYLSQPLSPSLSSSSSRRRSRALSLLSIVNRHVESSVVNQTLTMSQRTISGLFHLVIYSADICRGCDLAEGFS
jgi:hypothetical protein